jgi:hypothetical protein
MANLAASNVTVSILNLRRLGNSKVHNRVKLVFGDGTSTYPQGGIPLTIGNLGCPNVVESLIICDQSTNGYNFQFDSVNVKLVITQGPSHANNFTTANNLVADGATTRLNLGANIASTNTGSNITIVGGGTNGGVQATTVGQNTEVSGVALAANITVMAEVIGW